jgi:hypothetical protein
MSEQTSGSASSPSSLPDAPNLDWLRKQAKRRLEELRTSNPDARLADAQIDLARRYGFSSWRALKAHVDALGVDGRLFDAAKTGDVSTLTALLDAHPEKLHVRTKPYGSPLSICSSRADSTRTCARRATTRTPCTGPQPRRTSTSCVASPTRAAT